MTPQGRLVAARYRDGKLIKGYSCDFRPDRPVFHVRIDGQDKPTPIALRELKAVFFIKTIHRCSNRFGCSLGHGVLRFGTVDRDDQNAIVDFG